MSSICVIGAGMAGLCAAKYSLQNDFQLTVFEQTNEIGGTWVYTDLTDKDEHGLDVHSSMYKNLRTNLPKEIMGFYDYPMPNNKIESYIPANDVLEFLNSYCDHFEVRKHIKFLHHVIKVNPIEDSKWNIHVKNLINNEVSSYIFDFVMVCNGHYSTPRYPLLPGMDNFQGKQIHSHQFRCPDDFREDYVLIVGAGPSGRDIANELCKHARKVTVSHHMPFKLPIPSQISQVSDIKQICKDEIEFINGFKDKFTVIIYCTGYFYSFPFLSDECCIKVDENYVQSLYKQCININFPTMSLIGLPFRSFIAQMIDIQIRFVMEFYTGRKKLPSKQEMLQITKHEMEERWQKGWKKSDAHMLAMEFRTKYYTDLAKTAGIANIKLVMEKLIQLSNLEMMNDVANFRNHNYRIIDDENFEEIYP